MKKILVILLMVILVAGCGFGVWGTLKFRKDYNTQLQQNQTLVQQNAQVQAQIDAIGAMGVAYQVNAPKASGEEIKEADLKEIYVPMSINGDSTIATKEELVGRHYKVDVTTGTIITKDLLMPEGETTLVKFPRELQFKSLPVQLEVGDYVDVKFLIANGEEYVILPHKEVQAISGTTLSFNVSEEENQLINSAIMDVAQYSAACMMYCDMYLEPGNGESAAFYPVQESMQEFIMFNPNITDYSRCINVTMRQHIDQCLIMFSNGANQGNASSFISGMEQQLSAQLSMRSEYLQQKEQAERDKAFLEGAEPEQTTPSVEEPAPEETIDLEAIN